MNHPIEKKTCWSNLESFPQTFFQDCYLKLFLLWSLYNHIPSRELTYPTLGKRKIIFKMPFLGDMLVPWRVLKKWDDPPYLECDFDPYGKSCFFGVQTSSDRPHRHCHPPRFPSKKGRPIRGHKKPKGNPGKTTPRMDVPLEDGI